MRKVEISADAAINRLIELAGEIDQWQRLFEDGPGQPAPGSSLAGDDRWTAPFQCSQAAWHALSHAIDNLHAFRQATLEGGPEHYQVTTRPFGAYPNLRAALENAAVGVWLLGPASRRERVIRRYRWFLDDGSNRDQLARLLPDTAPVRPERLRLVREVAQTRGFDARECEAPVGFGAVVKTAAAHIGIRNPDAGVATWRLLSGLTHGDWWASFNTNEFEHIAELEGDLVTIRTTTPIGRLVMLADAASRFLRDGLALFENRHKTYLPDLAALQRA